MNLANDSMCSIEELVVVLRGGKYHIAKKLFEQNPSLLLAASPQGVPLIYQALVERWVTAGLLNLYVTAGGNINERQFDRVSLIYLAEKSQNGEIVEHLKSLGARLRPFEQAALALFNEVDDKIVTSVVKRAFEEDTAVMCQLDERGWTLLHIAARNSCMPVAKLLLNVGADPNSLSDSGESPLGLCGRGSDDIEIRELLISYGAKYGTSERFTELIREGREPEVLKWLETDPSLVNGYDPRMGPYLHIAARFGESVDVLENLLKHGADPNVVNSEGETALFEAVKSPAKVKVLLDHGANINHQNCAGETPLHRAAARDKQDTITVLVESGSNLNLKTKNGETVLDYVIETSFVNARLLVSYLKRKGALSGLKVNG